MESTQETVSASYKHYSLHRYELKQKGQCNKPQKDIQDSYYS